VFTRAHGLCAHATEPSFNDVIERLQLFVIEVKTTSEFHDWMRGLRDGSTRRRLAARSLKPNAHPRFETIARVCQALEVRLVARVNPG
jgi:uncharacterized protein YeeX (DUF496 family)